MAAIIATVKQYFTVDKMMNVVKQKYDPHSERSRPAPQ